MKQRHYLLPRDVQFTAENDHNPEVLEECPRCHGSGKWDEYETDEHGTEIQMLVQCPACRGSRTTGARVRYFDNDAPVATVPVGADGWLTCPCCGWRFSIRDTNVWTGLRHCRCGQRIRPTGGDA